jgi:predicted nucleic acid-binding protein
LTSEERRELTTMKSGEVSATEARVQFGARLHRVAEGNEPGVVAQQWRQWRDEDQDIVAPVLLRDEVTNALHRIWVAGELSGRAVQEALCLPIRLDNEPRLQMEALDVAARFTHPAAYDGHYLALAERLGIEFWTADRRLFDTGHHRLPGVNIIKP